MAFKVWDKEWEKGTKLSVVIGVLCFFCIAVLVSQTASNLADTFNLLLEGIIGVASFFFIMDMIDRSVKMKKAKQGEPQQKAVAVKQLKKPFFIEHWKKFVLGVIALIAIVVILPAFGIPRDYVNWFTFISVIVLAIILNHMFNKK